MFKIPEIMTTESFWAPIAGIITLLLIGAVIWMNRYRRPEIYSKKQPENKGEKHGTNL